MSFSSCLTFNTVMYHSLKPLSFANSIVFVLSWPVTPSCFISLGNTLNILLLNDDYLGSKKKGYIVGDKDKCQETLYSYSGYKCGYCGTSF